MRYILFLSFFLCSCSINDFRPGKVTYYKKPDFITSMSLQSNLRAYQQQRIEKAIASNGPIEIYDKSNAEYNLDIIVRDQPHNGLTGYLSSMVSILSFCIVPTYTQREYLIKISLHKNGTLIKSDSYTDSIKNWCFYTTIKNTQQHQDNEFKMILNAYIHYMNNLDEYTRL